MGEKLAEWWQNRFLTRNADIAQVWQSLINFPEISL